MQIEGTTLPIWGMEIDADEARRTFQSASTDESKNVSGLFKSHSMSMSEITSLPATRFQCYFKSRSLVTSIHGVTSAANALAFSRAQVSDDESLLAFCQESFSLCRIGKIFSKAWV